MEHEISVDAAMNSGLVANGRANLTMKLKNVYRFECRDKDGNLKWVEEVPNLVTTAGKNDILAKYFAGAGYTAAWFVGLVDGGSAPTYAATDTMAAHAGWTENVGFSNGARPALAGVGAPAGGSVTSTAAVFNINASGTIAGAFVNSDGTKGGTVGTLYGEASFAANRSVLSGDTLNVTVTLSVS
jgi:hypothetical protein